MNKRILAPLGVLLAWVALARADGGGDSSAYTLVGSDDRAALERGEWQMVGLISRGKEAPKELVERFDMRLVFKGNTLTQKSAAAAAVRKRDTPFKLNANGKPKEIDWALNPQM